MEGEPAASHPVLYMAVQVDREYEHEASAAVGGGQERAESTGVKGAGKCTHRAKQRLAMEKGRIRPSAMTEELRRNAEEGLTEVSRRRICEECAAEVLQAIDEGTHEISDESLHYVLMLWIGTKNYFRKRVNPEGTDHVRSISLGVVSQHTGEVCISNWAKEASSLTKLLNEYARKHFREDFHWSTITVNDGFASARHRDSGNAGISYIKSVGCYTGGSLYAWPNDDRKKTLASLDYGEAELLDPKVGAYFDGTQAHETQPFDGWRVSVVWFTAKCLGRSDSTVMESAKSFGLPVRCLRTAPRVR